MKLNYKNVCLLTAVALFTACSNEAVSLTDKQWQCREKKCDISFVITNNSAAEVNANYAVRVQSAVQSINSDMRDGLVVAEVKERLILAAGEKRMIHHNIEASRPPTNVVVNAWVK